MSFITPLTIPLIIIIYVLALTLALRYKEIKKLNKKAAKMDRKYGELFSENIQIKKEYHTLHVGIKRLIHNPAEGYYAPKRRKTDNQ